jgi:hypothetical protein
LVKPRNGKSSLVKALYFDGQIANTFRDRRTLGHSRINAEIENTGQQGAGRYLYWTLKSVVSFTGFRY